MFTDSTYFAIAIIVAFGALPFVVAGVGLHIHRKNERHQLAMPFFFIAGVLGVPVAIAILDTIKISKYPDTDRVFGVVFVIWLAALGGFGGAVVDRLRFGHAKESEPNPKVDRPT